MQQPKQDTMSNVIVGIGQLGKYLRRSPGSRSLVYFGAATLLLEVVAHAQDRTHPDAVVRLHLATAPFGAVLTYALVSLRPEDQAR
jgi:hypothetical protein